MLLPPARPDQRQKDTMGPYRFFNNAILYGLIKEMRGSVMNAETSTSLENMEPAQVCLSRTGVALPRPPSSQTYRSAVKQQQQFDNSQDLHCLISSWAISKAEEELQPRGPCQRPLFCPALHCAALHCHVCYRGESSTRRVSYQDQTSHR